MSLSDAGDGADIRTAIKDCDNAGGGEVVLDPGIYHIAETIDLTAATFGLVNNVTVRGAGQARLDGYRGISGTELRWEGPAGDPMVEQTAFNLTWKQMTLSGDNRAIDEDFEVASHAFKMKNNPGFGASRNNFEDLIAVGFSTACFENGGNVNDGNTDFTNLTRVSFGTAPIGYINTSNQAVCHKFDHCNVGSCGIGLDFRAGGDAIWMGGSSTFNDLFLKADLDHQAGQLNIFGLKIEPSGYSQKNQGIVWAPQGGQVQISFYGLRMGSPGESELPDGDATLFRIGGGVQVYLAPDCLIKQLPGWPLINVQGDSDKDAVFLADRVGIWSADGPVPTAALWPGMIVRNQYAKISCKNPTGYNGRRGASFAFGSD